MIENFPLPKEEWYRRRDDRTKRVTGVSGFENFTFGISVDPRLKSSFTIQVMTLISANLAARWCRRVYIELPIETESLIPNTAGKTFVDVLKKAMYDADPYGEFAFGRLNESECQEILHIGSEEVICDNDLWIDGCGWIAGIGRGKASGIQAQDCDNENLIGASFSACLGSAEVFKHAVGLPDRDPYVIWRSLYDFSLSEEPTDLIRVPYVKKPELGTIYQVGCGAVGSSLDYILALTQWQGRIILIDYDNVTVDNCNRSLAFSAYDATSNVPVKKTTVCYNFLQSALMSPLIFEGDYSAMINSGEYFKNPPDLILCLANDRNVWADIQHNFPPLVLHATTTPNWAVNLGRHIPKKEWCILCRFFEEVKHKFVPKCSEGQISVLADGQPIFGVLPFLSTTASVLMVAEMAKMHLNGYPVTKSFVEFSTKPTNGPFMQIPRSPRLGCECNRQTLDIYPIEIRQSKYWHLTEKKDG